MTTPDIATVRAYLLELQERICAALEQEEPVARFREDRWNYAGGEGGGRTRILAGARRSSRAESISPTCSATGCRPPPAPCVRSWPDTPSRPWGCRWWCIP